MKWFLITWMMLAPLSKQPNEYIHFAGGLVHMEEIYPGWRQARIVDDLKQTISYGDENTIVAILISSERGHALNMTLWAKKPSHAYIIFRGYYHPQRSTSEDTYKSDILEPWLRKRGFKKIEYEIELKGTMDANRLKIEEMRYAA